MSKHEEKETMPEKVVQQLEERLRQDCVFRHHLLTSPVQTLREYDLTEEEKHHFIVPNFSWLIENRLAGVSYPRSADALALLWHLGVKGLLSLSEEPGPPDPLWVPGEASPCHRFYGPNPQPGQASHCQS